MKTCSLACSEVLEQRRLLAGGALDPSYGAAGVATVAVGEPFVTSELAPLTDCSLLIAGNTIFTPPVGASQLTPTIVRLRADGSLDPRFGEGGVLRDTPGGMAGLGAIAALPDGGFVVAGARSVAPTQSVAVVARYDARGRRDRTFDRLGRGSVLVPFLAGVTDVLVQDDGRIVLAGFAVRGGDGVVARLLANGRPDTTFHGNGLVEGGEIDVGNELNFNSVAAGSNGTIVVLRNERRLDVDTNRGVRSSSLTRLLPNGTSDPTFGFGGQVTIPEVAPDASDLSDDQSRGFFVYNDESIVVLHGRDNVTSGEDLALTRFTSTGDVDTEFGTGGSATLPDEFQTSGDTPEIGALAELPSGDMLVSGLRESGPSLSTRALLRLSGETGAPIANFGTNGIADLGQSVADSDLPAAGSAVAADGTILTVLTSRRSADSLRVARVFADDAPVATLSVRDLRAPRTASLVLTVTYRDDDDDIDLATLDNRDLRITGPDGFVRYAKFERAAALSDGRLVARYKLSGPGSSWDAADNGDYVVQLVGRQVGNDDGEFIAGRFLGSFVVEIDRGGSLG